MGSVDKNMYFAFRRQELGDGWSVGNTFGVLATPFGENPVHNTQQTTQITPFYQLFIYWMVGCWQHLLGRLNVLLLVS